MGAGSLGFSTWRHLSEVGFVIFKGLELRLSKGFRPKFRVLLPLLHWRARYVHVHVQACICPRLLLG